VSSENIRKSKTIAFMRVQGAMGMIRYEQQGVQGQGLMIDAGITGVHLSGPVHLQTVQDLNSLAKAISDAWKGHLKLKLTTNGEPDPSDTPPVSGAM
jgi:hypothetical protein